ncbi:methyltransferase domain-containing protein [Rhizorhapis sp.]|uniref:methyltransferase domain-containing protein n=1 Tax=Rhizorhapis sp. TaxID=1968842 RepID=UPI002B480890|nr:methyltransferase domain-containing protein [Rhizorhapis sp.]HKR17170.1 methyltransferase domain-containing protein [Rhizorhapis sp.]
MMFLAWGKHRVNSYSTPTPFNAGDEDRSASHANRIVDEWTDFLTRYAGQAWEGQDVLELGPGGTLGTGALILTKGAISYQAVDAFPLAERIDLGFYEALLNGVSQKERLLQAIGARDKPPFIYSVDPSFRVDIAAGENRFSRLVSCAAFEHFDDVADTIARMSRVAQPGAIACIRVDFSTHSRWLRDKDPNNIYRYPDWLYWSLPFPGKPNRVRPDALMKMFEAEGWEDIEFHPVRVASPEYCATANGKLAKSFRRPEARMEVLSGIILGRRTAG